VIALLLVLLLSASALAAPAPQSANAGVADVRRLYAEQRWEQVVRVAEQTSDRPAELDFYYGLALARLNRLEDAERVFRAGRMKAPRDKRFPVELAGLAFRRKDYGPAKSYLHHALRVDPNDAYARDFLATIYLLEGNLEAALLHWNHIARPRLNDLRRGPELRTAPVLLDRAFATPPGSVLRMGDYQTTRAWIENLHVFSTYRLEMEPGPGDTFDLAFDGVERNGWGAGKVGALLSFFRGLPYQTVHPGYSNWNAAAMNLAGLFRWDAQKRRAYASFSGPLNHKPASRFGLFFDARNENWDISRVLLRPSGPTAGFNLRKIEAGAEIRSVVNGRWAWGSSALVSNRDFGNLAGIPATAAPFFTNGVSLQSEARLERRLLSMPERRFTLDSEVSGNWGKHFSRPLGVFGGLRGSLRARWLPLARGEDYELQARLRLGNTFGRVPFDELSTLGLERDGDLWLRGHIGTRNGRKGNAPLGRRYALLNIEFDKVLYQHLFTVKLGPFLDGGRVADPSGEFGSQEWLWDAGAQLKIGVAGVTVVLSYGRDLRGGRNAFYSRSLRPLF
jgi:tetratricopeptide (TPR) repeat protein